jgi:hypothetical protein
MLSSYVLPCFKASPLPLLATRQPLTVTIMSVWWNTDRKQAFIHNQQQHGNSDRTPRKTLELGETAAVALNTHEDQGERLRNSK